jgi:protein-S-isoprenylcysteine O-methyltransferase Ste14
MDAKLIFRYCLRESMGLTMMGVALFWSAGRIDWWQGWAVLAVMLAWILATFFVMIRYQPGLFAERLGPRKGSQRWDAIIMGVVGMLQLARYIIAGLDKRWAWSQNISAGMEIAALILCVLSYALFVWATASNKYFSQIVRIQTERDHSVQTDGPYQWVRHPGYAGAILFEIAVPILLGSWWTCIPSWTGALLLILRTALEDRMLQKQLPGYADYAKQVRYRLIPNIW